MPGKLLRRDKYDLVDEASDGKVPVHTEEAFEHGIRFKAKYIGTKEIAKPNSRSEIVAAMRRIRYEYKLQGTKKDKVEVQISVDGLRVVQKQRKKKQDVEIELSNYPVHRIFYVSHDSQDLQIFSYIAKDGDIFKCFVFKATSKALAMHIVRSIGQAFEVCHKKSVDQQQKENTQGTKEPNANDEKHPVNGTATAVKTDGDGKAADENGKDPMSTQLTNHGSSLNVETLTQQQGSRPVGDVSFWTMDAQSPNVSATRPPVGSDVSASRTPVGPVSIEQLQRIYQQQLEQQRQEAQAAILQAKTYKQKFDMESGVRAETQSQLEAALKQNKELIVTVQYLLNQVQALYSQQQGASYVTSNLNDLNRRNLTPSTSQSQSSTPLAHSMSVGTGTRAEPVLPTIPPPPKAPNPAVSRDGGSGRTTPSHSPVVRNGVGAPLVDLSLRDNEMVEPRRIEPFPQQFLQFVFDQSTDRFDTMSHPSLTSLASEPSQTTGDASRSQTGTPKGSLPRFSTQQNGRKALNGT